MLSDGSDGANGDDHEDKTHAAGTHWTDDEETLLKRIVSRWGPERKSHEEWEQLAVDYSQAASLCGLPSRTGSGCRNRARRLGIYAPRAQKVVEPEPVRRPIQASFATPELATIVATLVKTELADVLEDFAKRLRESR